MNDTFKIFNEYMGDGVPGKYWFIGVEEATPLSDMTSEDFEKEASKRKGREYRPVEPKYIEREAECYGNSFTRIYQIMSKIIVGTEDNKWKEYQNEHLLQEGSKEFHMNLFPAGKKRIRMTKEDFKKFEDSLREKFGLDYKEYINEVQEKRFLLIRNFRNKHNPEITICFGLKCKNDFVSTLALRTENEQVCSSDEDLLYYPYERVFITPFFRYGKKMMSHDKINKLMKKIEEMKKS